MIGKEVMERLKERIGERVTVVYVWYGVQYCEQGVLKAVNDFKNIEITSAGIPFVGYGCAIQKIIGKDGELYENPLIPSDYDVRDFEKIDKIVALSFGEEIAEEFRKKREEEEKAWRKKETQLNKEIKKKALLLIREGEAVVKPELKNEWNKFASRNTQDFYSGAVVEATVRIMKVLSEGRSPAEAEATVNEMGLTGFQMGCVAQVVVYFHPRGEEFRQYWNRQFLSEEEAKKAKGVVNPAVFTISLR